MRNSLLGPIMALPLLLFPATSQAISINFNPLTQNIPLGSSFDVDIVVSGLEAVSPNEIVSAYDLQVSYDESLLSTTGFSFGFFLNGGDSFLSFQDVDLSNSGIVNLSELSLLFDFELDPLQPDSILLATLRFYALGPGTSSLTFIPDPTFGVDVKGLNDQILPLSFNSASVTVVSQAVPEPSTLLLFGVGLVFLAIGRRRLKIDTRGHARGYL